MQQINYPTTILYGEGALAEMCLRISAKGLKKPFIVSDQTLEKVGLVANVCNELKAQGLNPIIFSQVTPNPTDEDVLRGADAYRSAGCDSVVALGGGSPMDAAKAIMIAATHDGPLAQYDDLKGGDQLIVNPLPPLYAIPTTAGTGSEVGRSGLIVMRESGLKTIFFHPDLLPKLAVLDPEMTKGLPASVIATTGLDAFSHSLEAFLARSFHPMSDGIALEGMSLVLKNLPLVLEDNSNTEARARMLLAASMGATAFQKGLGMIHSLAHALGGECHLHHGTGISLTMPWALKFIEEQSLNDEQKERLDRVQGLFVREGLAKEKLSSSVLEFVKTCFSKGGVAMGLKAHGIKEGDIDTLVEKAFIDPCHPQGMVDVGKDDLRRVLDWSM